MKRIAAFIFSVLILVAGAPDSKTPYQKFIEKKGLQKAEGFVKIYKDKEDIWLEIPDSLVGRDIMFNSYTLSSTCTVYPNWRELSKKMVYRVAATDSLLLFQQPGLPFSSLPEATLASFPIKYRGADTTAFVINATKLFDLSSKDVVSYVGKSFKSPMEQIVAQDYKSNMSRTKNLLAGKGYVGVEREATFSLSLSVMGLAGSNVNFSSDIVTTLTLLPKTSLPVKEADSRIGARVLNCQKFDEAKGLDVKKLVSRWDLSGDKKITIYVDTLITPSFRKAVAEGIMTWNEAFVEAGLGEKIEVKDVAKDVEVFDQMTSVVMACGSTATEPFAVLNTAPDGQILSVRMGVPDGFMDGVRRQGMLSIADVDARFTKYNVPEDALSEVLRSKMMALTGLCLGLEKNYAGSYAYTPEQLRDPSFTAKNGITASVTDDVLFNVLAQPGDKENGVTIISDKLGAYDKYAINWIYADGKPDSEPEHLFIGLERPLVDYRAVEGDLGSDLFAYVSAGKSHVKYAADHISDWITIDDLDGEHRNIYVDYVWMKYTDLVRLYQRLLGALKVSEVREGLAAPRMEPLDKSVQKEAMRRLFDEFADVSFLDENKKLLEMSGLNRNLSSFTNVYVFTLGNTAGRLANVAYSYDMAGSDYSPREFLDDVRGYMMENVSKGKLNDMEDVSLGAYIQFLIANCSVTKANYYAATKKDMSSLADIKRTEEYDLRSNLSSTIPSHTSDYDVMCLRNLQEVNKLLKKGRSLAKDKETRGKIDYLLSITESALQN